MATKFTFSLSKMLFYFGLFLLFIPRFSHPGLPYAVSGLDLFLPFFAAWFLVLPNLERKRYLKGMSGHELAFLLKISAFMLPWILFVYLIGNIGADYLKTGVLQAVRHIAAICATLFIIWGVNNENRENEETIQTLRKFVMVVFVLILFSSFVYHLLDIGYFGAFRPRSNLTGSSASMVAEDLGVALDDRRFAGFTGSPTTFATVCTIFMVFCSYVYARRGINSFIYPVIVLALFVLVFLTASKSALAAFAVLLALCACMATISRARSIEFLPFSLISLFFVIAGACLLIYSKYAYVLNDLSTRGEASLLTRFDKYERAFRIINESPTNILFGFGWKSFGLGWHSEIVEIFMRFGIPLGVAIFVLVYIKQPLSYALESLRNNEARYILMIYLGSLFPSLFQEIFFDPVCVIFIISFAYMIGKQQRDRRPVSQAP